MIEPMKDMVDIFKALANETRLRILMWLRDPDRNFPPQGEHLSDDVDLNGGVCVSSIKDKAGLSQSTISHYLDILLRAGLVKTERHGKWTYYRRNEEKLKEVSAFIDREL